MGNNNSASRLNQHILLVDGSVTLNIYQIKYKGEIYV